MRFYYKVLDENLVFKEGVLEAVDAIAAEKLISDNRWQAIEIRPQNRLIQILTRPFTKKLSYESIAAFCSQLAMMIRTGANMVKGLEVLKEQSKDKELIKVIDTLITQVSRGSSLSGAMMLTGTLPELLVNLVAAGEESGNLDTVLNNMAEYYERESFIRKKVGNAAVYPLILIVILIIMAVFFITFILPEITGLLRDNGGELPLLTKVMLDVTDILTSYYLVILLVIVALVLIFLWLRSIPQYLYLIDRFKLRLPLLGSNLKHIITARFCRTMALFLKASIPIVPILDSMQKIVGNEAARVAVMNAKNNIIKGERLAKAFADEHFFDEMVIQMMTIGEETGKLDDLMGEIASFYDRKAELGVAKMVALLEPAFTIIVGILAGLMIVSIALPIFNLSLGIQ